MTNEHCNAFLENCTDTSIRHMYLCLCYNCMCAHSHCSSLSMTVSCYCSQNFMSVIQGKKMGEAHLSSKPYNAVTTLADLITKKKKARKQEHETLKRCNFVRHFFPPASMTTTSFRSTKSILPDQGLLLFFLSIKCVITAIFIL